MTMNNQSRKILLKQPTGYTPFRVLADYEDPWRDMEKLFSTVFSLSTKPSEGEAQNFAPPVDVQEFERVFEITIELPGLTEENIDISMRKDSITITGDKSETKAESTKNVYRMERRYGKFSRMIPLPENVVDEEKVSAEFKNGVLTIMLPKREEQKPSVRKIAIGSQTSTSTVSAEDTDQ